jgi:hypothetical protein
LESYGEEDEEDEVYHDENDDIDNDNICRCCLDVVDFVEKEKENDEANPNIMIMVITTEI